MALIAHNDRTSERFKWESGEVYHTWAGQGFVRLCRSTEAGFRESFEPRGWFVEEYCPECDEPVRKCPHSVMADIRCTYFDGTKLCLRGEGDSCPILGPHKAPQCNCEGMCCVMCSQSTIGRISQISPLALIYGMISLN